MPSLAREVAELAGGGAAKQADGLLLLLTVAALRRPRPCLYLTAAGCLAHLASGARNRSLSFRGSSCEGLLFGVLLGPLLAAVYGGPEGAPAGALALGLATLGSAQALLDFTVDLGTPAAHVVQVLALSGVGAASAEVPLVSAAVFLASQKLVLRRCLGSPRAGRCFSASEGLFWAQLVAALGVAVQRGLWTDFAGWGLQQLFCGVLLVLTILFLALTAAARVPISRLFGSAELSPLAAGAALLLVLAGWLATGFGAWARRSPQQTPLGWLVETLFEPGHWQLWLLQWPLPLVAAVGCIDIASRRSPALRAKGASVQTDRAKVMFRKAFHAVAVLLFVPPLLAGHADFLGFAMLIAALLFVAAETCRASRVPRLAGRLDAFVSRYLDKREDIDRGDLVLTHLYLLLGCAIPVWLEGGLGGPCAASRSTQLRGAAGILLVGVGDACAAAVGVHFGRHRWPSTHRTVEGSAAFLASVACAGLAILGSAPRQDGRWQGDAPECEPVSPAAFLGAALLSALLEVYTRSIDNLVLPLHFCPTLRVLQDALG